MTIKLRHSLCELKGLKDCVAFESKDERNFILTKNGLGCRVYPGEERAEIRVDGAFTPREMTHVGLDIGVPRPLVGAVSWCYLAQVHSDIHKGEWHSPLLAVRYKLGERKRGWYDCVYGIDGKKQDTEERDWDEGDFVRVVFSFLPDEENGAGEVRVREELVARFKGPSTYGEQLDFKAGLYDGKKGIFREMQVNLARLVVATTLEEALRWG